MVARADVERALASAVETLGRAGESSWPGEEIAPIAYRRWNSFSRRNKRKRFTKEHKICDLMKGLQAHFEPEIPYTHPRDWQHLAQTLASVLHEYTDE